MSIKYLILAIIVLIGIFLRFYRLADFPVQLNHDEVSQLYDAISITETKRDIYGNFMPLAFPSIGEYKVGHYIYITSVFYKIFGNHEVTIRIPAAFFGSLTVLAVFLFTRKLTDNWILALLGALMVAVTPSEIFYSRKSFENVIGISLDFLGLYCLLKGFDLKRDYLWSIIGIFILVLAMYIYTSQTIIIPLLFLLFTTIYRKKIKIKSKKFITLSVIWILLIIPLLFVTITNSGLRFRAASVFITQDVGLGRLIGLTENPVKAFLDYGFTRYLNQFNLKYLFANGLELTNQGLIGSGPLLLWQLPFFILGILFLVKNKDLDNPKKLLLGMLLVAMIPSALTFEVFSPHRAMLAFSSISIISAFGIYWFLERVKGLIIFRLKVLILVLIFFALSLNVIYFFYIYMVSYPYEKSQNLQYPFKQVAQFAWLQYNNYDQIIFDPKFGEAAPVIGVGANYYLAYYGNYSPKNFQKRYQINNQGLFFDKFSIREVFWAKDKDLSKVLIIGSSWSLPVQSINKDKILKTFYFYDGKPAFYAIEL